MKLTKTCAKFLRKHGGTILAIGASIGVGLTMWETGKATVKATTFVTMNKDEPKKRKEAEEDARQLHAELAHTQQVLDDVNRKNAKQFWTEAEKDICCDGKATITKNPE